MKITRCEWPACLNKAVTRCTGVHSPKDTFCINEQSQRLGHNGSNWDPGGGKWDGLSTPPWLLPSACCHLMVSLTILFLVCLFSYLCFSHESPYCQQCFFWFFFARFYLKTDFVGCLAFGYFYMPAFIPTYLPPTQPWSKDFIFLYTDAFSLINN